MKTTSSGALKRIYSLPAVDSPEPFVNSSVNWGVGQLHTRLAAPALLYISSFIQPWVQIILLN